MKKIAPDYYDNLPCHTSWIKVIIDFVRDPNLGPKSRIRRTMRSDALRANNAIDFKSKTKVNEVLHDIDNNNNHQAPHLSKEERILNYKKKISGKISDSPSTVERMNNEHSKQE